MENKGNLLVKISLGINLLLIIAVIILFVKMPKTASDDVASDSDTIKKILPDDGQLNIAYFHGDSINENLLLMKEIEEMAKKIEEDGQARMRSKEKEIQAWQDKWGDPNNLLTKERDKYEAEAMKKQEEIGRFQQELQMSMAQQQQELMTTLYKRVGNAATQIAEKNGFDYVLSYQLGQNIYYCSPNFDVTSELIDLMNKEYTENTTPSDSDTPAANPEN
jgi:Skp family chaperone for outer membrane proteins